MTMKITAIEPQKRNPQRVNVYLDGAFAFGLTRITAAWLQTGQDISDEKITTLQAEDASEIAYQKALHFLSYRPRSSREIRQNLLRRGIALPQVEETLTRLQCAGLVNDLEFARAWVENRSTFQPRSKIALRMELRRKGLEDDVIQPVLDESVDDDTLALAAARKYARRLVGLELQEFRLKLVGYLARRGFSYPTLTPVIPKVWRELHSADDPDKNEHKD